MGLSKLSWCFREPFKYIRSAEKRWMLGTENACCIDYTLSMHVHELLLDQLW